MNSKKGKALALELMEDLLNEAEETSPAKTVSPKKSVSGGPADKKSSAGRTPAPKAETPPELQQTSSQIVIDIDLDEPGSDIGDVISDDVSGDSNGDIGGDDKTMPIAESQIIGSSPSVVSEATESTLLGPQRQVESEAKVSVGKYAVRSYQGGVIAGAETALAQSENLRIAQEKILDLEREIERLRTENEELGAAGETLRKRADELLAEAENSTSKLHQAREIFAQEKELLLKAMEGKERESSGLRLKIDEMEMRLSTNIQKIRVRERELENRLELVKMESAAIIRSKDELILDLKRQTDQINLELENYRNKGQELNKQMGDKQDMLRRTAKALRLALSLLESGDDPDHSTNKKAK